MKDATMNTTNDKAAVAADPLFDVIGRVTTELRDIALLIERLEPMLSDGRSTEFLQSPEHIRIVQGIDLAVQKARGLAVFLDTLGGELDADQIVDIGAALGRVTLQDMKNRLRAAVEPQLSADRYEAAAGDLEFF